MVTLPCFYVLIIFLNTVTRVLIYIAALRIIFMSLFIFLIIILYCIISEYTMTKHTANRETNVLTTELFLLW